MKTLEAVVASPPEREDLVVQLFLKGGPQWGEIFNAGGKLQIEIYPRPDGKPWAFNAREFGEVVALSVNELHKRLDISG